MTSTSTSQGYSLQRNSSKVIQPPGGRTADIFGRSLQGPTNDGLNSQQQQPSAPSAGNDNQVSRTGSLGSSSLASGEAGPPQQSVVTDCQQQPLMAHSTLCTQPASDARSSKKTIPVQRRNPITGEILGELNQPAVVRVRQPPGGRSSGIF